MRFVAASVIGGLLALGRLVHGFTNGTLLPSYLCNDIDGYPKSAGSLLPYLQLGINPDNYNQFPPGNSTNVTISILGNANGTQAIAPTSRQIVGSFHNGGAQLLANFSAVTPVNYEKATTNPIWLAPLTSDPVTGAGTYTITPGAMHSFVVAAHCPVPDPRGYNNAGIALDGLFLYAIDTATGQRIGSWVNVGATLTNWYACNPKLTSSVSVGIVHNQLATNNPNIANLTWKAPQTIQGTVQFKGAGVSDCGFGPVLITYNTTTNTTALSPQAQGLTANLDANNIAQYFNKVAAADLPQGLPTAQTAAPTVAPSVAPSAAPAPAAAGNTNPLNANVSGGVAIAIGVGGAVVGGIVVGVTCLIVNKRRRTNSKEPLLMNS
eukprot:TRINITY_DN15683_c0_g1_i1.p1 TRINITY_DN15683_c0_g1~~TRINITY_DN15683_c0_g1_i1.p1  ORF type:complete len:379 (+),score=89.14 TRINITY_DN15683_c0_g1_i1:92-1228(+)